MAKNQCRSQICASHHAQWLNTLPSFSLSADIKKVKCSKEIYAQSVELWTIVILLWHNKGIMIVCNFSLITLNILRSFDYRQQMKNKCSAPWFQRLESPQNSRGTDLRGGVEKEDVWNQVLWSFSQNCGLSSLELLETPCELSAETFLSA